MIPHLTAVTQMLVIFLLLGAAYLGWGRALSIVLGIVGQTPDNIVMSVWLGWAFTLLIFQVLHFFLPITAYVVIPIFVLGLIFSIPQIINAFRSFPRRRSTRIMIIVTGLLGCGAAVWVVSRAMLAPTNYDSGLYHFNTIRWINTYPLVPGLGILHGRLAFNQSFFVYVATLNFYPFFGYGRSLANSFLLLLLVATLLPSLLSVVSQPALLVKRHIFLYASDLFILPIIVYLALFSDGLASPTPDLASTLLQLAMFVMLADGIAEWLEGQREQDFRVMVLVVLAVTAVTIKLSNLAFSAVIIGIGLAYTWRAARPPIQGAVRIGLPVLVVMLVWGLRGFVLSGAPLYPSTIGYVPVEWSVPIENVVNEANWVYSWARQPEAHWRDILGSWDWLGPWSSRILINITGIVYPVALTALFCIIAVIVSGFSCSSKPSRSRYLEWSILLPSIFGLAFWFITAPDPRFANALFWLLSIGSSLVLLSSLQAVVNKKVFPAMICMVFLVANIGFVAFIFKHRCAITDISLSAWYPVVEVPLNVQVTDSGLIIYKPEDGIQCWDSRLPSTPDFNASLRLRIPGTIASGFTVAKQDKSENSAEQNTASDGEYISLDPRR
jgi:hypothetical protein